MAQVLYQDIFQGREPVMGAETALNNTLAEIEVFGESDRGRFSEEVLD